MINFPSPSEISSASFDEAKWLESSIQELRKTTGYKTIVERSIINRLFSIKETANRYAKVSQANFYYENSRHFLLPSAKAELRLLILKAIAEDLQTFFTEKGFKFELVLINNEILEYNVCW